MKPLDPVHARVLEGGEPFWGATPEAYALRDLVAQGLMACVQIAPRTSYVTRTAAGDRALRVHRAWLATILALVCLVACGPTPADMGDVLPPLPLEVVPEDDTLRAALERGVEWWRDAGETRSVAIVSACSPGTLCVPATWHEITTPKSVVASGAYYLGEYLEGSHQIQVLPRIKTADPIFLHAIVAHELGHAIGYGHAPPEDVENLMAPKPDIASGTLCIESPRALCREL